MNARRESSRRRNASSELRDDVHNRYYYANNKSGKNPNDLATLETMGGSGAKKSRMGVSETEMDLFSRSSGDHELDTIDYPSGGSERHRQDLEAQHL